MTRSTRVRQAVNYRVDADVFSDDVSRSSADADEFEDSQSVSPDAKQPRDSYFRASARTAVVVDDSGDDDTSSEEDEPIEEPPRRPTRARVVPRAPSYRYDAPRWTAA